MTNDAAETGAGGHARVNGLNMYYEIHGTGRPLVLLHGAYMTIDAMGAVIPGLAGTSPSSCRDTGAPPTWIAP